MRSTAGMNTVWIVFAVAALVWILGLVLGAGGWIWVFFVIALLALGTNYMAFTGRGGWKGRF